MILYASTTRHRKNEPGHVLQRLSDRVTTLPLADKARGRQQQSRLDQRQRQPPGHHQQSQHHQLPQRHGRRGPAYIHRENRQGRPPESVPHSIQRARVQTTHRGPHNHEATQRIPTGNKKSDIRKPMNMRA